MLETANALRETNGWPWYVLVQSYATNGGVARWNTFLEQANGAERIRWECLFADDPDDIDAAEDRLCALSEEFAARRWLSRTRPALLTSLRRVHALGGPDAMALVWNTLPEAQALLCWLKTFPMIGDKYARNMCMDVAHPLIRDHVALDHRLNRICDRVAGAPPSRSYAQREAWLRCLARDLDTDCWHLDRLLFRRYRDLKADLG